MYNGFRSRNAWNVSLWIWNTEWMAKEAERLISTYGRDKGALHFFHQVKGSVTPDGAPFSKRSVREAFRE